MGVEYKIKFAVRDKKDFENFLTGLSGFYDKEVTVALEDDGFYFCDNLSDRSIASDIFYRLIQAAAGRDDEVIINEL